MSGLYITKPGVNVLTNTNPKDFIFNSDYNTYKSLGTITGSISVTDGGGATPTTATQTVPLTTDGTYIPYYFSWISFNDGTSTQNAYDFLSSAAGSMFSSVNTTDAILTFNYQGGGSASYTIDYIIYLFANPF